ncbi:conserved hypothetical prolipoprotein [Mycoplasma haemofelis str. Langford 1]|uniref:Conserved hypothetical prolipoprotein n=1 Tax=Mycoplasma haemofelis (strain Langford 1) TaxID=941640 RepID=E8ZHW2_MYCHL|nr:DUF31 family protein [Mycoplasma haemofelis]CBY92733.1 conserved hypothetical prolipoprotein [Mycoplasma haemofelis str. Langford 1]
MKLLNYSPLGSLKGLTFATVVGGAAIFGAFHNFSWQEYFYPATGDFYVPESIYKTNASFFNNSSENKAYSSVLREKSRSILLSLDGEKGTDAVKRINDYTLKISMPCGSGTAWILDYVIPEDGKYPTKWFIATNVHVISDLRFASNPYNQILPISLEQTQRLQKRYKHMYEDMDPAHERACISSAYGFSSINLFRESTPTTSESNSTVYYTTIKEPKLFYAAINFLGYRYSERGKAWWNDNYYKDFAVLEIDFQTEDRAKKITDDFYNKYGKNATQSSKHAPLNIFDKELMAKYSSQELDKSNTNYYISGYPVVQRGDYTRFTNLDSFSQRASVLSYAHDSISVKNIHGDPIRGMVDVYEIDKAHKNTATVWQGRKLYNWGYNYLIENVHMRGGASGSLTVDKEGNVLGLYRMHDSARNLGFVEPLRSNGLYVDSKVILPKYDLIKGAEGQTNSYKQQLDRYYPNAKTFLKEKGWKI